MSFRQASRKNPHNRKRPADLALEHKLALRLYDTSGDHVDEYADIDGRGRKKKPRKHKKRQRKEK